MGVSEPEHSLVLQLLRLVRYRLEHPDYLSRDEYGLLLSDSLRASGTSCPPALRFSTCLGCWSGIRRQGNTKKACELLEEFPGKSL